MTDRRPVKVIVTDRRSVKVIVADRRSVKGIVFDRRSVKVIVTDRRSAGSEGSVEQNTQERDRKTQKVYVHFDINSKMSH